MLSDLIPSIVDFHGRGMPPLNKELRTVHDKSYPDPILHVCKDKDCKCICFVGGNVCNACGHSADDHKRCSLSEYQNQVKKDMLAAKGPCIFCNDSYVEFRCPSENVQNQTRCDCTAPICESCWVDHFHNGNDTCPLCGECVIDWIHDEF